MDLGEIATSAAGGGMSTGSPWGAVGAGVLNYLGTQSTNEANADIAASNNQWSANQYANRYQTMVKDIQAAGLNPMLAYSQSPGSAPSAQQVQFQNPMSSAVQGFTDVLGTRAKATSDVASAHKAYTEADRVEQETKKLKTEIEQGGPEAAVRFLKAQADRMEADKETPAAIRNHLSAMVTKLGKETELLNLDIEAARRLNNFGRTFKELGPFVQMLLSAVRK